MSYCFVSQKLQKAKEKRIKSYKHDYKHIHMSRICYVREMEFFTEGIIRKEGIAFLDISTEINKVFYDNFLKITFFRRIRIIFYVESLLQRVVSIKMLFWTVHYLVKLTFKYFQNMFQMKNVFLTKFPLYAFPTSLYILQKAKLKGIKSYDKRIIRTFSSNFSQGRRL